MKSLVAVPLAACLTASLLPAAPLTVAAVSRRTVECMFSRICRPDLDSHGGAMEATFALSSTVGAPILRSSWVLGGPGSLAEGLHAYEFQVDLKDTFAPQTRPCIDTVVIPFGPIAPLDWDNDGAPDGAYLIAPSDAGVPAIAPASVEARGENIVLRFAPGVCAGDGFRDGEVSFVVGLVSSEPPQTGVADLAYGGGFQSAAGAFTPAAALFGFARSDTNASGDTDLSDGVKILGFLFLGDEAPECLDTADTNDDGEITLSDAIGIFAFLFLGDDEPRPPGPFGCGPDPTADRLGCAVFDACAP